MPPKLSSQPLTADAKRLRTIIISFPLFVATSWILYKRAYLGEEQKTIPQVATQTGRPEDNKIFGKPTQGFGSK
ncbi:hypothetical protein FFLO_01157 [Filobasidium floriforme]|uniref:Uncharacterized protein n=1 Tax=Filobasidium floriforme TaxID=5210 RepID=A0A8K0JQR2_9TREE|nr:hypothetical protein FFLO_01157 [Filobasidium floriforme]